MTLLETTVPPSASPIPLDREFYVDGFLQRWDCENTRRAYRSDIEALQSWCTTKGLDLFSLHRIHLEVFMRYLADERGNSAMTILHRIGTIGQFVELAVDDGLSAKNPTRLLKLPMRPPEDAISKALSSRDFERLVWAAAESNATEYALVLTMGMCGLRVSPACSLDVETATVVNQAHRQFVFTTKGGATQRVPQPPAVIQALDLAIAGRTLGPLFLRRDGSRMTRSSALRVMKRLARAAGITQRVTNHTLRHTFAVTSLNGGASIEETALSLGHKDSSTTFRFYGRKSIPDNQHTSHRVVGSILLPSLSLAGA
ncbi:tyrosine-type recombinase/integrase [Rhodococcus fascians]|uniref:tyrosine-type recombinase/integrase n=1 Tax=Rhodococcoides fascians TaxID=1828 RepID=UPI0024BBAE36|nr:tyrosine-type recombinase/integrase [Rhodococcus fascians]MDJ0426015.1 tyrosine-type recombinase/integrase [Rhodococcus fascians]